MAKTVHIFTCFKMG